MVQWLSLHAPNSWGRGLIPGQETGSHILQLRVLILQLRPGIVKEINIFLKKRHLTKESVPFPLLFMCHLGREPGSSLLQASQPVQYNLTSHWITRKRFHLMTVYLICGSCFLPPFDCFSSFIIPLMKGGWQRWTNHWIWCISLCSFLDILIMVFPRKIH